MDKHELALRTYEAIQKRKKQKELQRKIDISSTGWNGYKKVVNKRLKNYY